MTEQTNKYRVFISAAEPSGDSHCANLISAMKKLNSDIDFVGVGGPKMADAGCELLEQTAGKAVMTYKALAHVSYFFKLIKQISDYLANNKVDLVIVCDSPAFNFHIAKSAKKNGIQTLFYVAPQLWAWGGWRIGKLHRTCDKLCCILPFEREWFGQRGVEAVFVGNPLMDNVDIESFTAKDYSQFEPKNTEFALIPGSRATEIESLWQPMQQIAMRLKEKLPDAIFITVAADQDRRMMLEAAKVPGFDCRYSIDSVRDTAKAADFSLVASGSATLEVASAGCPMVIMYQSSRLIWHLLGRRLLKTKHLSLVNILAGRELVPEFMPYFTSIEPILHSIEPLIGDKDELSRLSSELIKLTRPLAAKKARSEVAQMALEMLA